MSKIIISILLVSICNISYAAALVCPPSKQIRLTELGVGSERTSIPHYWTIYAKRGLEFQGRYWDVFINTFLPDSIKTSAEAVRQATENLQVVSLIDHPKPRGIFCDYVEPVGITYHVTAVSFFTT